MRWLLSVLCVAAFLSMSGCGTEQNELSESTNDIQQYLKDNPDAVEKPEDMAGDESEMFDESMNGDAES